MSKKLAVESGCYVDGHWGIYGIGHMADQLQAMGVPVSDEELAIAHGDDYQDDHGFLSDELEVRLNDLLPTNQIAYWFDGEFFVSPWCGDDSNCTDDTCYCKRW